MEQTIAAHFGRLANRINKNKTALLPLFAPMASLALIMGITQMVASDDYARPEGVAAMAPEKPAIPSEPYSKIPFKTYGAADGLIGMSSDEFKTRFMHPGVGRRDANLTRPAPTDIVIPANRLHSVSTQIDLMPPSTELPTRWERWQADPENAPAARDPLETDKTKIASDICDAKTIDGVRLYGWRQEREIRRSLAELMELRQDGLTEEERDFQRDCLNSIPVPASMQRLDDQILAPILNDADFMAEMTTRFARWQPLAADAEDATRAEYFTLRHQDLQYISDELRGAYDLEPIPVIFAPLPDGMGVLGMHSSTMYNNLPAILMNSNTGYNVVGNPYSALHTLLEEVRHSIDSEYFGRLSNNQLDRNSPMALHAAIIRANQYWAMSSTENNPITGGTLTTSYFNYENQYLERAAKLWRCRVADHFIDAIDTRLQNSDGANYLAQSEHNQADNHQHAPTELAQQWQAPDMPNVRHTIRAPFVG